MISEPNLYMNWFQFLMNQVAQVMEYIDVIDFSYLLILTLFIKSI